MKLLFDRQMGPTLVRRLADIFPDSEHVDGAGLSTATDAEVWDYAKMHGFLIITKDKDFVGLSALRGHPPKVIVLRIGNCSVQTSADLLRKHSPTIHTFVQNERKSLLTIV